ncbi:MAG: 7-cyano-7-deazaguanine synthase QueC [Bacteroidota bacterium]|nr:7-cyano-7-deazaguanine synthase QueC [Candidatus Kapabacteria bacterium]MDW8219669.1 7-cyano-7-deazaguanine synthase QueC [Bacteroidota bacterium]
MPSEPLAVVLISGGMDSAVCTAIARVEGYGIAALHLNYGQRTQERELQAFHDIAEYYCARHRLVVDVSHFALIGGSSLTDTAIPVEQANIASTVIPTSYVPFRNANILAIAVSWAEVLGAIAIYIGAVEEDSSGYPDCRKEFYDAFQKVIDLGTKPETHIAICTPLITYTKKDIVQRGKELGVPFHMTWSCYKRNDRACGECDSCALRLRGFYQAGLEDPIPYACRPVYT